jgi:hypothetical protein
MTDYQESSTTHTEEGRGQRIATFKVTQLIWLFLGILEGLLGLRFIFKLIGVNAEATFAKLIYSFTDLFVMPFQNLIGTPAAGNMVMEISTIIAMIVYLLIGWALERIVYVLFYRPRGPVSVSQRVVSEHVPQPQSLGTSQTTVTKTDTRTP